MKIKKGDKVAVLAGKDKGKEGKVQQASHREGKIIVEGVNKVKKHLRPKRSGEKGQIVSLEFPIQASNVILICPKCGKRVRVGYKRLEKGGKHRVCKKCKAEI